MQRTTEIQQEISFSGLQLNIAVIILTVPVWIIFSGLYAVAFGWTNLIKGIIQVLDYKIFILLILGIGVHELLHALTWILLQKEGFKNIKFGFNFQSLTPYTHYTKPMKVWKYRIGGLVPGLIMGIVPSILSFVIKNGSLNFIGFLFIWAATGDLISLWLIRKLKSNQWVQDHPEKLGVIILD